MGLERPLPEFLALLFWDVNLASLGPGHEAFVIERILNYGDILAIQWMWRTFPDEAIISVVRRSRRLTRKAASFWALIYDVPPGEVRSLMVEADWTGVSQAVPEPVRLLLPAVGPVASSGGFYLAGGTAAALQLGHRQSVDLDFFSPHPFNSEQWLEQLARLGSVQVVETAPGTLHVLLNQVRLSFFHYAYPLITAPLEYQGLTLASLPDISLMKIVSISHRGARKDFIDLYVISTRVWPLAKAFESLPRKFTGRYSLAHLLRSLQYFDDAEHEPMPALFDPSISWAKIKSFFQDQVRSYVRNLRSNTEALDP